MPRSICGAFQRDGGSATTPAESVAVMLDALPGRGRVGRSGSGAVSFGCRGTWEDAAGSITAQGQCSVGSLAAVVDARIDNRPEVFDALGFDGSERFRISDCELVLRAYERWGKTARNTCMVTMLSRCGMWTGNCCSARAMQSVRGPSTTRRVPTHCLFLRATSMQCSPCPA